MTRRNAAMDSYYAAQCRQQSFSQAGTAASLLGAATFMMAGLISPVVGWLGITSATPMGAVQAACILLAIAALWLVVRPRTVPSIH